MKIFRVCLVSLGLMLFTIACQTGPDVPTKPASIPTAVSTATPDALAAARTNYEKHCKDCHGDTGDGGVVTLEDKKLKVPSLLKGHVLKDPDDKLAKQIANGEDEMPAFKDKMTTAEINDLVNYIRKGLQKQ